MGLNKVTFNINSAGIGTPLASKDHISGIVYYNDTLPTGFATDDRIKIIFSLSEFEALGAIEGSTAHGAEWYHVREFFQKQPQGQLFVGYFAVPTTPADFLEVQTVQNFALGTIRQVGVYYKEAAFSDAQVTALQAVATALKADKKPLSILYGPDISGTANVSSLSDQRALAAPSVSVCIGQDGNGKGAALFIARSYSITDLGAKLGAVSAANVNESISYEEKFPMVTDGTEFDVAHFSNGQNVSLLATSAIEAVDNKGYIFLIKEVGFSNTFNNDSYSSAPITNDLATIENNRTIDKATRNLRTFITPKLGGPLRVNADGTLREDVIKTFKSLGNKALSSMESDGELSAYEVIINSAQNVVATSTLAITAKLVPVGVTREIIINLGFVPNL
jgi:hypothetical protein